MRRENRAAWRYFSVRIGRRRVRAEHGRNQLDDELRRQRDRFRQFFRHERFRREWRQLERRRFEQQFGLIDFDE